MAKITIMAEKAEKFLLAGKERLFVVEMQKFIGYKKIKFNDF